MYKIVFSLATALLLSLIQSPADAFQHARGSGVNSQQAEVQGLSNSPRNRLLEQERDRVNEDRNRAEYELAIVRQGGHLNPLQEATQKLKGAENSEDKEQAMDAIRDELSKQYDEFLAANEKQVEELQQRLDNLREQLVRRREAKEKMVDLELERVVNESEGLIWPDRGNRNRGFFESRFEGRGEAPSGFSRSLAVPEFPRPPAATSPAPAAPEVARPRSRSAR